MLKALPARFQELEYDSQKYPGIVFVIRPLLNQVKSHIEGQNTTFNPDDPSIITNNSGGIAYDIVGFSLAEIRGLDDWEPEWEERRIGARKFQRIIDEWLDRIPADLWREIMIKAMTAQALTQEEVDNLDFTADSSIPILNVSETNQSADVVKDSPKSDTESSTEDESQ